MSIHMRIVQDGQTVADLPEWPGPVPARGDYIFRPPPDGVGYPVNVAGCVRVVAWRTHDRSADGTRFVQAADPYVELTI